MHALLFLAQHLGQQRDTMSPHAYGHQVVAMIYRKVTGGFRSSWGAAANAISILETARRRGQNRFDTLTALFTAPLTSLCLSPHQVNRYCV